MGRDVELGIVKAEEILEIPQRTLYAIEDRAKLIAIRKAEGKTNKEIAEETGVSVRSVQRSNGRGDKVSSSGDKMSSPKKPRAPTKPDPNNPDYEIEEGDCQPAWRTGYAARAGYKISTSRPAKTKRFTVGRDTGVQ